MIVLGIETSCDETAVALISEEKKILGQALYSQIKQHQKFGGVVPELAARSHLELIDTIIIEACKEARIELKNVDLFASTVGPGLAGGLLTGTLAAKTLSCIFDKPFIAVNHLQGHALMPLFDNDLKFPFLLLLISGGHTQFLAVLGVNNYKLLGETLDDAVGEAFDKTARMMGLSYPGGIEIEKYAKEGNKEIFKFPLPLVNKNNCDLSFSGLKTAVLNTIEKLKLDFSEKNKRDICASLQYTISQILTKKTEKAIEHFEKLFGSLNNIVVSGGVAANSEIRESITKLAISRNLNIMFPPKEYCTDNGVMIAWSGYLQYMQAIQNNPNYKGDSLYQKIHPKWALEDLSS